MAGSGHLTVLDRASEKVDFTPLDPFTGMRGFQVRAA